MLTLNHSLHLNIFDAKVSKLLYRVTVVQICDPCFCNGPCKHLLVYYFYYFFLGVYICLNCVLVYAHEYFSDVTEASIVIDGNPAESRWNPQPSAIYLKKKNPPVTYSISLRGSTIETGIADLVTLGRRCHGQPKSRSTYLMYLFVWRFRRTPEYSRCTTAVSSMMTISLTERKLWWADSGNIGERLLGYCDEVAGLPRLSEHHVLHRKIRTDFLYI